MRLFVGTLLVLAVVALPLVKPHAVRATTRARGHPIMFSPAFGHLTPVGPSIANVNLGNIVHVNVGSWLLRRTATTAIDRDNDASARFADRPGDHHARGPDRPDDFINDTDLGHQGRVVAKRYCGSAAAGFNPSHGLVRTL